MTTQQYVDRTGIYADWQQERLKEAIEDYKETGKKPEWLDVDINWLEEFNGN